MNPRSFLKPHYYPMKLSANSEALLTAFISAMDFGVILTDAKGNIIHCSKAALQLMGLEDDHHINSENWVETLDILDPVSLSRVPLSQLPLLKALRGVDVQPTHLVFQHKITKKRVELLNAARHLKNRSGQTIGILLEFRKVPVPCFG
jgi:PAS domain-containing protein